MGALSASVIVIVSDWVPLSVAPPPDTDVTDMIAVSFDAASYKSSAVEVNVSVPDKAP